jgi:Ca2+:H+ antiporter
MRLRILFLLTPLALVLDRIQADPTLIFVITAIALIPLIGLLGKATEHLADSLGPTTGGLLAASFANFPDLVIGLFALQKGLQEVVKASISGAILVNILFTLGLAIFVGGLRHHTLRFDPTVAGLNAGMLQLAAVALLIPALFNISVEQAEDQLSLEIAAILFLVYIASLIFTFARTGDAPATGSTLADLPGKGSQRWSLRTTLSLLLIAAIAVGALSETLTDTIEPMAADLGLTPVFAGIILLALVGSVSEMSNAVRFARSNQFDLVLGLAVGSSLQTALFVAPTLVFVSYWVGDRPLDLLFSQFEIAAVVLATFIALRVLANGETTWIEGLMAIAVYLMLGYAFYCLPA